MMAAIDYPFATEPTPGDGGAVEIAPGVLWLRMPLFAGLQWINVWALAEPDGWAIVDTGLRNTRTTDAWLAAFAGPLGGRPATRVIATHMHPDHVGMAGWLAERFSVRLWMSRLEYMSCRLLAADTGRPVPAEGVRFYREAGWSDEAIETYKSVFGGFGKAIYPLPDSYKRIGDGDEIEIGGLRWQVVVGSGHSPEHACLHCPELKLLISGDQVLPKISSNVSVYPTEPDADPLNDWMESLARLKERVPDDVLVLPAHNSPFRGLHARIDQLIEGHVEALRRLEIALAEPKRALDVFPVLFSRPISHELLFMATGESIAHLNYLTRRGRAKVRSDPDGVKWWEAA
jgi:glyoxylase-like metal-dependent hydrolase (beta-lactamase superfamily II)